MLLAEQGSAGSARYPIHLGIQHHLYISYMVFCRFYALTSYRPTRHPLYLWKITTPCHLLKYGDSASYHATAVNCGTLVRLVSRMDVGEVY